MQIIMKNISEIIPYQKNAKLHPEKQIDQIAKSIKEFGFNVPILIDDENVIIAGHGRYYAALKLGFAQIPAIEISHLSEAKKKAFIIADNKLNLNTSFDMDILKAEIEAIEDEFNNLDAMGFDAEEIQELFSKEFENEYEGKDLDEVPEPPESPVCKLGDVWILGNHRLMCGDSTDEATVKMLMNGEKADMIFTDPPYNYASESRNIAADISDSYNKLKNSEWDKNFKIEPTLNIIEKFIKNDSVIYICSSHFLIANIWNWMKKNCDFHSFCVWSKPDPMPSLMKRHWTWDTELIAYGTKGKHVFNAEDGKHSPSTWLINKQQGKEKTGHPTQKPVAVPEHAILKSSLENQKILDLFGGSGSTLIASEKTNRYCFMIELDPVYCDVIINRWQNLTGKNAVHVETNKLYNQLKVIK